MLRCVERSSGGSSSLNFRVRQCKNSQDLWLSKLLVLFSILQVLLMLLPI